MMARKVEVVPTDAGRKQLGKNRFVSPDEAKVLVDLGMATYATKEIPKAESVQQYATRDMVAAPRDMSASRTPRAARRVSTPASAAPVKPEDAKPTEPSLPSQPVPGATTESKPE